MPNVREAMPEPVATQRRRSRMLTTLFASAALLAAPAFSLAQSTVNAMRPSIPYRVWYGASTAHAPPTTIDTAGGGDPRAKEALGMIYLDWAYGTQISWQAGPQYWIDRCAVSTRTRQATPQYPYNYIVAGIALDEWIGYRWPEVPGWIQDGLHVGRDQNPELFVALWANGWNDEEMYEMGLDNTIDLFITQGYTKAPDPGLADSWHASVRELETMYQRGLLCKTVLSLGHITDLPNYTDGSVWTEALLREMMGFLKDQYPDLPGVAFFPGRVGDQADYDALVQLCNNLAKEYWPDNFVPEGVYAMTPQKAPYRRVDAYNYSTSNGGDVGLWTAKYPSDIRNQQWRLTSLGDNTFRIQPAYSDAVSLDVSGASNSNGARVQLWQNNNTNAQKWKLTRVQNGFLISPLCAPNKYLRANGTSNGTLLDIWENQNNDTQLFSLTPEICSTDPIPPTYQAEDAMLANGAWVGTYGWSHTGAGYINFHPNSSGESVTFNNVDGGDGGSCVLLFRYACYESTDREVDLTVNGSTSRITLPRTDSEGQWKKLPISRNLQAGATNTIKITTVGQRPGNIDALTILPGS